MQDRPDLIQSELAGLAFDSLQQAFAAADIERMFSQECPEQCFGQPIFTVVDPAAGGPQSEYAVLVDPRAASKITQGITTEIDELTGDRQRVYEAIPGRGAITVDEIALNAALDVGRVMAALALLEVDRFVAAVGDGWSIVRD